MCFKFSKLQNLFHLVQKEQILVVLIKKTDGVMNPVSKCYEILTMWILNCNNNNITVSPVIESSNNITANTFYGNWNICRRYTSTGKRNN